MGLGVTNLDDCDAAPYDSSETSTHEEREYETLPVGVSAQRAKERQLNRLQLNQRRHIAAGFFKL